MKKFLIICASVILLIVAGDIAVNRMGFFIDWNPDKAVTTFVKTENKIIYLEKNGVFTEFEVKGVNLGAGIPGYFDTEFKIDSDTYLKWFALIQEMGANTIRVSMIMNDVFYNSLYEYNRDREQPLYLIQGISVNEYAQNSRLDAYADDFLQPILSDVKDAVDIIHGNKKLALGEGRGSGSFRTDISQWVLGYTIGGEWNDETVAYTDDVAEEKSSYQGQYMHTSMEATAFEAMLARVGDQLIAYETTRYKTQRLVAFCNTATTDPFEYPESIEDYFKKIANIDTEHIKTTDQFMSGCFAAYQVFPYYPDYYAAYDMLEEPLELKDRFTDSEGVFQTYLAYLTVLNEHHTMPVVITEFGVPASRGMSQPEQENGRTQGRLSETQQAQAVVDCYQDIKDAGCAGSIVYNWQDEWYRGTWNTNNYVDLEKAAQWNDYQTSGQFYGIMAFDPGKEKSVCYVDGDTLEWKEEDIISGGQEMNLSMKYDEKFVYLKIHKSGYDIENDILYVPLDITPESGSTYVQNYNLKLEREADFLLVIDGKENSRLLVQERYEALPAVFWSEARKSDPYAATPDKHTTEFKPIQMLLRVASFLTKNLEDHGAVVYETGKLTHGNANPDSSDYNSLADFYINGDEIEIRIPWLLLNFSNPSEMKIQADYYEHYGVEELQIDEIYAGVGDGLKEERISMDSLAMEGWGNKPSYHERLKPLYNTIKKFWTEQE